MDNWLTSSREAGEQKNTKARYEKNAWDLRKILCDGPANVRGYGGKWDYISDDKRRWTDAPLLPPPHRYNIRTLTKGTRNLALAPSSNPSFMAEKGDKEISRIYREFWIPNDKDGFLDELYRYALLSPIITIGTVTN